MFKHILIATDGSPLANKAAKAGIALASALGAKVTGYYAVELIEPLYVGGRAFAREGIEDNAREAGQQLVDAIGKMAKAARVPFASVVTTAPSVYGGIIAAARKQKCDLICMASHGHSGLTKLIMGSVTQNVLTHSRIPVVVYR